MTATLEAPASKKQAKPVLKFRVLGGSHYVPTPQVDEDGDPILTEDGKPVMKDVPYGPNRPAGDIVTTTERLDRKFNRPGSKKYELLGENEDPILGQLQEVEERNRNLAARLTSSIRAMTARELIEYCEAEGFDHQGETDKDKLVQIVLRSVGL